MDHTAPREDDRPHRLRVLLLVSLVVACFAVAALSAGFQGRANAADASQDYLLRVNALRRTLGLGPLLPDVNLTELAQGHTVWMAQNESLEHTTDLGAGVTSPWTTAGENIGFGGSTDLIWNAFINSPHHYDNLVDPRFTHIGIGVVTDAEGVQWTTQRFLEKAESPVAEPTPPAAAPAPARLPRRSRTAAPSTQVPRVPRTTTTRPTPTTTTTPTRPNRAPRTPMTTTSLPPGLELPPDLELPPAEPPLPEVVDDSAPPAPATSAPDFDVDVDGATVLAGPAVGTAADLAAPDAASSPTPAVLVLAGAAMAGATAATTRRRRRHDEQRPGHRSTDGHD